MTSALKILVVTPSPDILGDMRELGHTAEKHAALAHMVEASGISILITVGPLMEHLNHAISSPGVTPYMSRM